MNSYSSSQPTQPPLAVVGLSALFPKAANLSEFWSNVRRGIDAISEVPSTHWSPDEYFDSNQKSPDMTYARRGGFLSPVPFDPLEFGISPNNLEAIDTSQLLGLVGAKRALEHAGYGAGRNFDRSRISCILGVTGTLEMVIPLGARLGHPRWRKALKEAGVPDDVAEDVVNRISQSYVPWQENSFPGLLGNVVAGRIANRLDLHGTNCVVDAACASSLSAIHLAALELWTGRSDMVVTGGIDTFNDIFMFMCFSKTPALSPTGDAKPFSDEADGTILGEGVGMLVLKRLADAERDGDRIYAVLKGIGTSSDGAGNAVYAPKAEGQIRCLEDAYRVAGISPDTIELVEAHGTGTKVGDATEVSGLLQVYKSTGRRGPWCAIGSIKSQIGHTKAAAGAAGILKAILALQHRVLPPTIKVNRPPAALLSDDCPFYVNTEARPWLKPRGYPRRAAVSAFGFGGSNFHCVLEESPHRLDEPEWDGDVQVITLSAGSPSELTNQIRSTVAPLAASDWQDVRTFAASSRKSYRVEQPHRLVLAIERDKTDLTKLVTSSLTMLERYPDKTAWTTPDGAYYGRGECTGKLGVLFPGQGAQYVGMMRELVCRFPTMQDILDEANDVFVEASSHYGSDKLLSDYIYPHPAFSTEARNQQELELRATQIAQPAIGAVSLAILNVLDQFGVRPEAVAGHSYGELTALCASSRFSPQSLYRLSALRGRLMAAAQENEGGMLAVLAPLTQIESTLKELSLDLVVANHNSPTQVVLSGRIPDIDRAASLFASRNIRGKKLPVAAAFHSPLIAPASHEFRPVLDEIDFNPSQMPVYANSTASEYPADPDAARDLLANQLARPVQFVREIEQMYADGVRTFLEVGPGGILTGLVNSILDGREFRAVATDSSNGKRSGLIDLANALANLSASGRFIRWDQWDPQASETTERSNDRRLRIPICGANYVKPRDPIPPRKPSSWHTAADEQQIGGENRKDEIREHAANSGVKSMVEPNPTVPESVHRDSPTADVPSISASSAESAAASAARAQTLSAIRETLLALQQMQHETSQLHQQFLDGQAAALATLSRLASQQFGDTSFDHLEQSPPAATFVPDVSHQTSETAVSGYRIDRSSLASDLSGQMHFETGHAQVETRSKNDWQANPITTSRVDDSHVYLPPLKTDFGPIVEPIKPEAAQPAPAPVPISISRSTEVSPLAETVLAVVSEKTGYPTEMLNLEMSLDHDLGIDSIKRVEILSALQERVPNLPAFQPDELGALHTLRDVVSLADARMGHVAVNSTAVQPPSSSELNTRQTQSNVAAAVPTSSAAVHAINSQSSKLAATVLEVVSEKTGYPTEMLNLEMSLDHDLGIDSIKRVEILSALQERVPNLPAFQPEELGALHTLKDVVALADSRMSGNAVAAPVAQSTARPSIAARVQPAETVAPVPVVTSQMPSLGDTVLAVVAEKTGYPTEMLNLEMSLDHDLGIDSIKRVEILSALQERVPNLPAFQPEELGALHTLKDVVVLADSRMKGSAAPVAQPAITQPIAPSPQPAKVVAEATIVARQPQATSLGDTVLAVVAEKTGYPIEMLNLEMSLDHDLGIDSIKRVEILSALQERVPELPAFQPDELGALHSLKDVVTLADARTAGSRNVTTPPAIATPPASVREPANVPTRTSPTSSPTSGAPNQAASATTTVSSSTSMSPSVSPLSRSIVRTVAISSAATRPSIALFPGSEIWITEDGLGLSLLVADHLTDLGYKPRVINLEEPQAAVIPDSLAGLIIIAPQRGMDEKQLWCALQWLQKAGPSLRKVGAASAAIVVTVSRIDGCFGFESKKRLRDTISGGMAGMAKCANLEWPEVTARAFDLSPQWSAPHVAAAMLVTEMLHEGPVEVGLSPSGPHALEVVEEDLTGRFETAPVRAGEVVVVTGGARGVTAEASVAIARAWKPHLVILGRSPEPTPEPDWLVSISAEAEIKKALISRSPAGATPRAIAAQCQEILAGREIARHLKRIRETGASVTYRSVDVRDATAVRPILDQIRRDIGEIRGLIHGAGVLADQRIEDKTKDQFERVYGTKVGGFNTLLNCLDANALRVLGIFSSYTARYGRVGQVDYAIANEVLNKQARQFANLHPNCRVASFNWGPWDGGMVNDNLRKLFASEGVGLIPLEAGAEAMIRELRQTTNRPVEVLLLAQSPTAKSATTAQVAITPAFAQDKRPGGTSASSPSPSAAPSTPSPGNLFTVSGTASKVVAAARNLMSDPQRTAGVKEISAEQIAPSPQLSTDNLRLAFERVLDVTGNPVLESHVIGGKAVLPVAIILEWLAHGAIHGNPGLELRGIDDFRVYQGVRLGLNDQIDLRVLSGKLHRDELYYKVPMRMVSRSNGRDVIHAAANVVLAPGYPSTPAPVLHIPTLRPYSMELAKAYASRLFHGPALHGITAIEGVSEEGIVVTAKLAPVSSLWMADPVRANWLADPLVIDSALQAIILWSQEMRSRPCLPCAITKYRQYRRALPRNGVKIIIRVQPATEQSIRCEIEFVDLQGLLVARMEGCESIADASLALAFQKNRIDS